MNNRISTQAVDAIAVIGGFLLHFAMIWSVNKVTRPIEEVFMDRFKHEIVIHTTATTNYHGSEFSTDRRTRSVATPWRSTS